MSNRNEKSQYLRAQELARDLTGYLNTLGDAESIKHLVEELSYEHRTLQQGVTRLCVAWLEHLAQLPDNRYDDRNKASVMLAREFISKVDRHDRHLPTI